MVLGEVSTAGMGEMICSTGKSRSNFHSFLVQLVGRLSLPLSPFGLSSVHALFLVMQN